MSLLKPDALTPAGIVMLNVAVNMAGQYGPLPLSSVWVANFLPIPYGPARIALNLLLLYWPSIVALALLSKGPPGSPMLRFLLGLWVSYIAVAAIVGPARHAFAAFDKHDPLRWLEVAAMSFVVMRLAMVAVNVALVLFAKDSARAKSIARTIRVDSMSRLVAIALGIAFWGAARYLLSRDLSPDTTSAVILAAPFIIGGLLVRPHSHDDFDKSLERAAPDMPAFATFLVTAAIFAGWGLLAWRQEARGQGEIVVSPVTGTAVASAEPPRGASILLSNPEPELHERLRRKLEEAGIPFEVQSADGKEVFRVKAEHREAAERVNARLDPEKQAGLAELMHKAPEIAPFREWLAAHGVGSEVVRRKGRTYVVVEPGPRHEGLFFPYQQHSVTPRSVGIDFFRLHTVAIPPDAGVERHNLAIFASTDVRDGFEKYVKESWGVEPRRITLDGQEFVAWDGPRERMVLSSYAFDYANNCIRQVRNKAKDEGREPDITPCR